MPRKKDLIQFFISDRLFVIKNYILLPSEQNAAYLGGADW